MEACPGCGLSLDAAAGFCPTCGWRTGAGAAEVGAPQPVQSTPSGQSARSAPAGRRSGSSFDIRSLPKWLAAIPIVTVLIAGHVMFPHLPWNRYAVRFSNTWDTDGLHVAAGLCVLLAGIGLTIVLARLDRRR